MIFEDINKNIKYIYIHIYIPAPDDCVVCVLLMFFVCFYVRVREGDEHKLM